MRFAIETDGSITPKEALEKSIETMIKQLKAIIGFKEEIIIPKTLSNLYAFDIKKEKEPILKRDKIIATIALVGAVVSSLAIILFLRRKVYCK